MEEYCDNCAEQNPNYFINSMPVEFESGNVGESASLCQACFISLTKAKTEREIQDATDINPYTVMYRPMEADNHWREMRVNGYSIRIMSVACGVARAMGWTGMELKVLDKQSGETVYWTA